MSRIQCGGFKYDDKITGSTITFIIVSHSSSGDTYRKFKYQDGYMMEIES